MKIATKIATVSATCVAVILGTAAFAGPVEDWVAQLEAEGYTDIEVEVEGDVTEIEGVLNGMEREIEINTVTGEILSDETEAEDDEDDDDEDDDDDKEGNESDDDDDEDEDDDKNDS